MNPLTIGRKSSVTLALAVAGVLGVAGIAEAQGTTGQGTTASSAQSPAAATPAIPAPSPHTGTTAPAPSSHSAAVPSGHASARAEQQIARLRRELHITSAQSQEWDSFAQVMRENAEHMDGLYEQQAQNSQTMNAVDGLKSYEQIEQAHVEDLQKLEPAFETLYNSLSDAQKREADELFRSRAAQHEPRPASSRTE